MTAGAVADSDIGVRSGPPVIDRKQCLLAGCIVDLHRSIAIKGFTLIVSRIVDGTGSSGHISVILCRIIPRPEFEVTLDLFTVRSRDRRERFNLFDGLLKESI